MTNKSEKLEITPETRIAPLLEIYPQLEEVLIEIAPPFAKLRNPALRKTVARVTTLRQAARVGNVPLDKVINSLRRAAGQADIDPVDSPRTPTPDRPDWCRTGNVVKTIDARPVLESGGHPAPAVMSELKQLSNTQIIELLTPFQPAPLIDAASKAGFLTWSTDTGTGIWKTYFGKNPV